MYKRFLASMIFIATLANGVPHANLQLGFGPAWHRYGFDQIFLFSPDASFGFLNVGNELRTDYSLMPYVQGAAQIFFNDYFRIAYTIGTGTLKRASATTTELVSEAIGEPVFSSLIPGLLSSRACSSIVISDFCVGGKLPINNCMYVMPFAGYVYNKQNPTITCLATTITYAFKNKWQGPFIGGECAVRLLPDVWLTAWYKFVFAHFKSQLIVTQKTPFEGQGQTLGLSDSTRSCSCAFAHGNLFNIALTYVISNCWSAGTGLSFLQYKNIRQGLVNLGPYNITGPRITTAELGIAGARMNTMWQQIMWTFNCDLWF